MPKIFSYFCGGQTDASGKPAMDFSKLLGFAKQTGKEIAEHISSWLGIHGSSLETKGFSYVQEVHYVTGNILNLI